jgi:arylsulfatase A-like enzyme
MVAVVVQAPSATAAERPPNFVIIFCDDLGYGDIGPFGSTKHRTPNLDRMAAEGMQFTDFYSTSGVCSPSRSSLMTGCYPRRVGLHQNETGSWVLFPGNHRGLNPGEITLAEVLKKRGYATAIVGKWHLGDQPQFLPTRQGFDQYFGIPFSNDMGHGYNKRYPPLPLLRGAEVIETEPDQSQLTPRYTAEAIKFITAHKDQPFFFYLPHTFPHNPIYASERFAGKSANGNFGDAVEEIDWSTGEILGTIKRLGIDRQTLVIFTSDNGAASRWGGSNGPLRGFKGSTWEGGQREPCIMRWPGKIRAGTVCRELTSTLDLMPTLAKLAGGSAPADRIIDGKDIWPLMSGEEGAKSPHEAFFYYRVADLQAVRSGKWKLHVARKEPIRGKRGQVRQVPRQLYDLESDIGEQNNVASQHAEVVQRLEALAEACRDDLGDGKRPGKNCRVPGHVENAKTLTSN